MISVMALITARGGSKSIPGKNVKRLAGKPLLAYSIEAARASRLLDRVILSTDDPEIAEVGRRYGVEAPFLRPFDLADDTSPVIDATLHAFQWLEKNEGYCPEFGMLLQPTSPFRTTEDIDAAIRLAQEHGADAVVSVTPVEQHPCLMKIVDADGRMRPWMPSPLSAARRQDLPPVYALNGAIYLVRRSVLLDKKSWCPEGALALVMPAERSLDIDTPWQWKLAEGLLRHDE